uniref:Uncharacterized protein n=1 Tax=Anopheles epiroticus TaxID=199890 RepID=A0A182PH44_9DIPT
MAAGKYFPVCLIGALLIGATLGSPLPQQRISKEGSDESDRASSSSLITSAASSTTTTTTEYPYEAVARALAPPPDRFGSLSYSSGRHTFRIGHKEDEQKRVLEEYYYHFERVEKNLPPEGKKQQQANLPGSRAIPRSTASCTALIPMPSLFRPPSRLPPAVSFEPDKSCSLGGLEHGRLAYRWGIAFGGRVFGCG